MTRRQHTSTLSNQVWMSIPSVGKHFQVRLLAPVNLCSKKVFDVENPGSPQRISYCAGDSFNAASLINSNISSENESQLTDDIQNGSSAIHLACLTSDAGMVDLLIQHGADINACDSRGQTPLHYCIIRRKPAAAKVLLTRYRRHFQPLYYMPELTLCDQIITPSVSKYMSQTTTAHVPIHNFDH